MDNDNDVLYPIVNTSHTANAALPSRHRALTELKHYI